MTDVSLINFGLQVTSPTGEVITIPNTNWTTASISAAKVDMAAYSDNAVATQLAAAKAYADAMVANAVQNALQPLSINTAPMTGYGAFEWWDKNTNLKYIIRDQQYIDGAASQAFIQGKAYTDSKVATATQNANDYTYTKVANTLTSAKDYTDLLHNADMQYFNNNFLGMTNYIDNHTWTVSKITDFTTAVTAFRLDQFQLPISIIDLNNQQFVNGASPTLSTHFTTKQYVDNAISGISFDKTLNQIPNAGDIDINNFKLENVADPTTDSDGANLNIVWQLLNDGASVVWL